MTFQINHRCYQSGGSWPQSTTIQLDTRIENIRFLITRSQSRRDCLFVEVWQLETQEPTTITIRAVHFYGSK